MTGAWAGWDEVISAAAIEGSGGVIAGATAIGANEEAGTGAACAGVPQLVQKRAPSSSDLPQLVQKAISRPRLNMVLAGV